MKLEVGKTYLTRGGQKVTIEGKHDGPYVVAPFIGTAFVAGDQRELTWCSTGAACPCEYADFSDYDFVREV